MDRVATVRRMVAAESDRMSRRQVLAGELGSTAESTSWSILRWICCTMSHRLVDWSWPQQSS